MIAAMLLVVLGVYLACGLAFAGPFALVGEKRIDPPASDRSWSFQLLMIPGTMVEPAITV
jgi:hypothetical protein